MLKVWGVCIGCKRCHAFVFCSPSGQSPQDAFGPHPLSGANHNNPPGNLLQARVEVKLVGNCASFDLMPYLHTVRLQGRIGSKVGTRLVSSGPGQWHHTRCNA